MRNYLVTMAVLGFMFGVGSVFGLPVNPNTKLCNDIAQTEADGVWQYVDKSTMLDCSADQDCAEIGLVGYGCGAITNQTANAANTAFLNSEFYQALQAEDHTLGCPHYALPCAFLGQPACRVGKCQGVLP